jgi:hypothetical protein
MALPSRKIWTMALSVFAIIGLVTGTLTPFTNLSNAQADRSAGGTTPSYIQGPFMDQPVYPSEFNGDVRDLPQLPATQGSELPAPGVVKPATQGNLSYPGKWIDPVVQGSLARGQMPDPIMNFDGLVKSDGGGWTPPDTNGDVGPDVYIQTVNIAVGIYDKTSGANLAKFTYDALFDGTGTPCDNQNRGDVVVLYDPQVDRWILTDFSLPGPYYECIAVSKTNDPVGGGWWFYALQANSGYFQQYWNDYPKLGVWSDGWYMSANMFNEFDNSFGGVRVWAMDRASMINGGALIEIHFDCISTECGSLLPGNLRGVLPPADSAEYFANVSAPSTLNIWQFHTDWATPGNSTFTGPVNLTVADFQMANDIPQLGTGQTLDSLGDRLMMQLQYRNINGAESLLVNHSVNSGNSVGVRWYEIRDPGTSPYLFQQGTYQPDDNFRWMGSIAADGEGDIAIGYSISSASMYPAIRYAGRLAGEVPNEMTQNETQLFQGPGSQTGSARWGDYSALSVDPVDDCTFWYTQEYATSMSNWRTRIGSFKFPSCGQPKGTIAGFVYNSVTGLPVAGVPLFAEGASYNFTAVTDDSGHFSIDLVPGNYDLTAGPFLPGYPGIDFAGSLPVTVGNTTSQDFYLDPVASLAHAGLVLADPDGNNNGFPEPGEQGLLLSESLLNQGAITSTLITSKIASLTPGVTVDTADSTYPDISAGQTGLNVTPYVFSIDPSVACGTDLNFNAVITDSFSTYNTAFSLNASVPLPRTDVFSNTVENGDMGWTTGGTNNTWAITTEDSHSPTHSWTDSPSGNYLDNTNSYLRTPAFDLTGKRHVQLSGWFKYALEEGWDYVYIEYSLNGGGSWNTANPLASLTGYQDWHHVNLDASVLDGQPNVALRFHLTTDSNTNFDGIHLDDIALSYEPFECNFATAPNAPSLVSPADGSSVTSPVTFVWKGAENGAPAEGYIVYIDDSPAITLTEPVTSTVLDVSAGSHSWFVKATNPSGMSDPSDIWSFDVLALPGAPILVSPADGSWTSSPVTFSWQDGEGETPAEGYILYIDDTPAVTLTTPVTSVSLDVSPWTHSWYVKATSSSGVSLPSTTWIVNVFGKVFLPLTTR